MSSLEDSHLSSSPLGFRIQPTMNYSQNLQLYRKLVEEVLVPNSRFNLILPQLPEQLEKPGSSDGSSDLENNESHNSSQVSLNSWFPVEMDTNFHDFSDLINQAHDSEFPTSFPGIELYPSSTESSETDFHMSRGLFPSTNFNNLDSSEGSDAVFEAITQEADKTKEERKLARRRERNRTSQRAFRARKEKYTQDLERHYVDLRQRYNTLVGLLHKATGLEAEAYLQNLMSAQGVLAQRE